MGDAAVIERIRPDRRERRRSGGADEAIEQNRIRRRRAPTTAPAIAASSRPPSRRSRSSASSTSSAWRRAPASTTRVFALSRSPATPVPGPVQAKARPPKRAADSAAAAGALPLPIAVQAEGAPRPCSACCRPDSKASTNSRSDNAGSTVKSRVGRSRSSARTCNSTPKVSPNSLIYRGTAGPEFSNHWRGDRGRVGRHAVRDDAVVGGENRGAAGDHRGTQLPRCCMAASSSASYSGAALHRPERPVRLGQRAFTSADTADGLGRSPGRSAERMAASLLRSRSQPDLRMDDVGHGNTRFLSAWLSLITHPA